MVVKYYLAAIVPLLFIIGIRRPLIYLGVFRRLWSWKNFAVLTYLALAWLLFTLWRDSGPMLNSIAQGVKQ
jgi:hypothetical protein